MHEYQSASGPKQISTNLYSSIGDTPASEGLKMRVLNKNRLLWNLARHALNNKVTTVLPISSSIRIPQRTYAAKDEKCDDGGDGKGSGPCDPQKWGQELQQMHVQNLNNVLKRFLTSCKPILTEEEMKKTTDMAKKFEEGDGAKLQELLEGVGKKECNWLAGRWLNAAYLEYRAPVTVYSSPGMTFPLQKFENIEEYLAYTSKVIYGMGEFKTLVDESKIPKVKMGKLELDNSQFGKVLGTARIPIPRRDSIEYNPCSEYIVVIHSNNFYKVPIYKENKLICAAEIAKQLGEIMNLKKPEGPPYGLLTHGKRDDWAEAYEKALKTEGFKEAVGIVNKALFTVSLDKCVQVPKNQENNILSYQLIHGGGTEQNAANRWMDKTIQLIANPNGMIGFTYEHSPAEGQPIAMMMDYVVKKITDDKEYGTAGVGFDGLCTELINFPPPNKCVESWMYNIGRSTDALVMDLEMQVCKFVHFGKDWIKKQKLGPDSFIQMAIQLAYYRMHKKPGAQYESAHLRIFYGGRTETIRSCSNESKEFVEAMSDNNLGNSKKAAKLREAVGLHQAYTKLALQGRGVDRHLLGLKLMAVENCLPIPEFFNSPGYIKSAHFVVSTSQVASVYEAFMCYGPTLPDGYGCCYNPRECDIIFAVSSFKSDGSTSAVKFCKELEAALLAMYYVLGGKPICKL